MGKHCVTVKMFGEFCKYFHEPREKMPAWVNTLRDMAVRDLVEDGDRKSRGSVPDCRFKKWRENEV